MLEVQSLCPHKGEILFDGCQEFWGDFGGTNKVIYTFLSEEMQDTAGGKQQDQMQEMLESAIGEGWRWD